jgi:hypothetical protein
MTEQAFLCLLASQDAPSFEVLESALLLLVFKPGAGMQTLLEGNLLKHTLILETAEPFIEGTFLRSGAKSYSPKVEVDVPLENLLVDVEEDSAAKIVMHRSVKLEAFVSHHIQQNRDLIQSLLEENVSLYDCPDDSTLLGCDIIISRWTCIVTRRLQDLYVDETDGGLNGVITLIVELSRAFERIVLIVEMNEADQSWPKGLDETAWIRLSSLFNFCGASVEVMQVFSLDQLALAIRSAVEEDCGLHDESQRHLQQRHHQHSRAESTSLSALKEWSECREKQTTPEFQFLCRWPSLNPCSAEHILEAMQSAGMPVESLVNINSDAAVLDVVRKGAEKARLPGHIVTSLQMTAEAVSLSLLDEHPDMYARAEEGEADFGVFPDDFCEGARSQTNSQSHHLRKRAAACSEDMEPLHVRKSEF